MNKKTEFYLELENNLVHKRFSNKDSLQKAISAIFNNEVNLYSVPDEDLIETEDYRFDFYCDKYDGTIWYAKTRANALIVTEVSID